MADPTHPFYVVLHQALSLIYDSGVLRLVIVQTECARITPSTLGLGELVSTLVISGTSLLVSAERVELGSALVDVEFVAPV